MAKGKNEALPSVPPTQTPHQAVGLLERQLARLGDIEKLQYGDPNIGAWESTTENVLHAAFGKPNGLPHDNTERFCDCVRVFGIVDPDTDLQKFHEEACRKRGPLLESFIEELRDMSPPSSSYPDQSHRLHGEVERVAGKLFRDSHYKQAALEAFILVINSLRKKSGIELDGDKLIAPALGSGNGRLPVVQFNDFATAAEKDEQQGLMFVFKGLVGLRNNKAHSNVLFDDRDRAYEYLALASLLLRLLERAKVNPPPP